MRKFVEFDKLLVELGRKKSKQKILIEKRPIKYEYGIANQGEIVGYWNDSDGDMWDAIMPGYPKRLQPGKQYHLKKIDGIVMLADGNHKLIIKLYLGNYDEIQAKKEIDRYLRVYQKVNKMKPILLMF